MKKRLTQPKNNKYYIRTVTGGLNGAVAGSPVIAGANVLCNCVGYANGRFNEVINDPNLMGTVIKFHYQLTCNAENFIESAKRRGLKISSKPVTGGIMVWQKGRTLGGGDGAGHVAFVEAVYDDGTILTSESGWASWAFKTVRRSNSNGRWGQASAYKFRGCIINPAVKSTVEKAPKLVVDGVGGACTVRAMQRFFSTIQDGVISGQKKAWANHYPALKAVEYGKGGSPCIKKLQKWVGTAQDGVLGEKTVKAWQKKLGVSSDGVFGANSMRAWQEYLNTHDKAVYPSKTLLDKEMDACKAQAVCMRNSKYKWQKNPTIEKSKKYGTCVTYVACVLQRLGYLNSGQFIWHDKKGKVVGANDKMTVTYYGKTLKQLKSVLKAGDIIIDGKPNVIDAGDSGSHIYIFTGKWQGDKPIIWDNHSAQQKKNAYAYSRNRSIIAVVRLK